MKLRFELILGFLILVLLSGCGHIEEDNKNSEGSDLEEQISWKCTHTPLKELYEMTEVYEDRIYAGRYDTKGIVIDIYELQNMKLVKSITVPGETEFRHIVNVDETRLCLLTGKEDENEWIWVDVDGTVGDSETLQLENAGEFPVLKEVYTDGNNLIYLWYDMYIPEKDINDAAEGDFYVHVDRVYVKDQQMHTILYEDVPDRNSEKLLGIYLNEDNTPELLLTDGEEIFSQKIRKSTSEKSKRDALKMENPERMIKSNFVRNTEQGVLYIVEGTMYKYDLTNNKESKVIDLFRVGIQEEDIISLRMNEEQIEIIDNKNGFEKSEYTVLCPGEDGKKLVTLGLMSLNPEISSIIANFNRYQDEIQIEPVVYVVDYDYDAGYAKLTMDIIQGKAPDLISVDGIEYETLSTKGAFVDLYDLMTKDQEINKDTLVSSVIKVHEVDGHLYTLAPTFRIFTMWGAESLVKGRSGVDLTEMLQILKEQGGDINSIFGFSADEAPFTTFCSFNISNLIHWEDGTCDFTGEEFKQILQFCKEYRGAWVDSLYEGIHNKQVLLTFGLINYVEDYCVESQLYGEPIQFIGYPTKSGNGVAAFFSGDEVAINSESKYKEEAWTFVKYLVQNGYYGVGFPVEKKQYENMLQEALTETGYAKRMYSEEGIVNIGVSKCEPEDVEAFRKLVDSISDKYKRELVIQRIIDEEAEAYFQNQKDLDEVCKIIQNKVTTYINEQGKK